jgi:predicted AlkP superfamily pyrophosphatase or phosphodiesterase
MRTLAAFVTVILVQGPFVHAQMGLPIADHVIVIGVDGMSPAGIEGAHTPVIDSLLKYSAYTFVCEAVLPTSSSPNWASIVMGAPPELHGVTSNSWQPGLQTEPLLCTGTDGKGKSSNAWPTIFGELRKQKPTADIACFFDWRDFGRLIEKGVLTKQRRANLMEKAFGTGHSSMTRGAVRYFKKNTPQLLFVHLDNVDHAGHKFGHRTPQYFDAVAEADKQIGKLVAAVKASGKADRTVILITADHGGIGTGHGGDSPAERQVPWILNGRKVIHGPLSIALQTFDTAATLSYILGVRTPSCWTGQVVLQAFPQ